MRHIMILIIRHRYYMYTSIRKPILNIGNIFSSNNLQLMFIYYYYYFIFIILKYCRIDTKILNRSCNNNSNNIN